MTRAGVSVIPYADSLDRIRELVRVADEAGLDLVGIQDHPNQSRFLDTFTLIATLLAETRRMSFFPDVANVPLRPPAVMAKMAATLDIASGGRCELGLGAGATGTTSQAWAACDGARARESTPWKRRSR